MKIGSTFRFDILKELYGHLQSFLFIKNKVANAILISPLMNPDFKIQSDSIEYPNTGTILIAQGVVREASSKLLCKSEKPIPAFVKRGVNDWVFIGHYKFIKKGAALDELGSRKSEAKLIKAKIVHIIYVTKVRESFVDLQKAS